MENTNEKTNKTNVSRNLKIHSLFKSISNTFISLFVPLIVLQQMGYQMAILYIIAVALFNVLCLTCLYKLIKAKPMLCICLHMVLTIVAYILVAVCELNVITMLLSASFTGIGNALYYAPIYTIISSNESKSGFSSFHTWKFLGAMLITLLNGYILNANLNFSVWLTCLISLIIYVISLIPFFMVKNKLVIKKAENITFKQILKKTKIHNLFNISFGLQDLIVVLIIPLFLYMNNLSIEAIAIVSASIYVVRILVTKIADKLYSKNKIFISVLIGSIIFVISSTLLTFITNQTVVYVLSILSSISFPLFFIPTCEKYGKENNEFLLEAMVLRETLVYMFRPLLLLPFLFIQDLAILIYIGILMAILMPIITIFFNK